MQSGKQWTEFRVIDTWISNVASVDSGFKSIRKYKFFHYLTQWDWSNTELVHKNGLFRLIIDNQRNGLETQAKSLMLLMLHPWYGLIRFTLEPCISTLNIFQNFVFKNFKQEQQCLCNYLLLKHRLGITKLSLSLNIYVIFDFRNIAIVCRLKWFYQNIQCLFSAFLLPGKVWKVDSFVDTVALF